MSTSADRPADGAAPTAVEAATLRRVLVGDLTVGCRVIGPLAERTGTGAAAGTGASTRGAGTPGGPLPALLLVMGSGATMDEWPPDLLSALATDREVVVFDNRGMGETDDPGGPYPFGRLADDTARLIGTLGHERMDVLGWSMGGDVAIDLAVRHPGAIGRLVSCAGSAGGSEAVMPSAAVIATLTDTSCTPQERGERLLELLFPPAYRAAHPDYARAFPVPTERASAEAIGRQNAAIAAWEGVQDGLARIVSPTLIITGTEDELTPPDNATRLAAAIPGSWLVRFPGAGHGLMYQEPERLASVVRTFLDVTIPPAVAGDR